MAQPVSTQNFVIHDANGKPQVIKVVQTTGPTKAWRATQSPSVVRSSSGLIKTVNDPVKQLYTDDDSDSGSGITVVRKAKTITTVTSPATNAYKIVRRPDVVQKVIQLTPSEMQAFHSQSEASSRLSSSPSVKRIPVKVAANNGRRTSPERELFSTPEFGKRRRADKGGKGLRHFSMKVCEKVREKGATTYNEVADELVSEFTGMPFHMTHEQNYDQKNIRRRVYDALNVLMAMNIISKEKKEIRWLGLPTGYPKVGSSGRNFKKNIREIQDRIAAKQKTLESLILQQVAFKNLVERNRAVEVVRGPPVSTTVVHLPMLVVSTDSSTTVNCSVSNDRKEYLFQFDDLFEIKDETFVLQEIGMMMGLNSGETTPEDLIRAKIMIPRSLAPYLEEMAQMGMDAEPSGSSAVSPSKDLDEGPIYLDPEMDSDDDMDIH